MSAGTGISERLAAGAARGLLEAIDAAATRARWLIYAAPRPPWGAATSAAPLAELPLSYPAGTVVGAALVFSVPTTAVIASDTGTPAWARLVDGDGEWLVDVTARLASMPDAPADPATLIVQAAEVLAGTPLRVTFGQMYLVG